MPQAASIDFSIHRSLLTFLFLSPNCNSSLSISLFSVDLSKIKATRFFKLCNETINAHLTGEMMKRKDAERMRDREEELPVDEVSDSWYV